MWLPEGRLGGSEWNIYRSNIGFYFIMIFWIYISCSSHHNHENFYRDWIIKKKTEKSDLLFKQEVLSNQTIEAGLDVTMKDGLEAST